MRKCEGEISLTLTTSRLLDTVQQTSRRCLINLDIGWYLIPADTVGINMHIISEGLRLQSSHSYGLRSVHICGIHIKIYDLRTSLAPPTIIINLRIWQYWSVYMIYSLISVNMNVGMFKLKVSGNDALILFCCGKSFTFTTKDWVMDGKLVQTLLCAHNALLFSDTLTIPKRVNEKYKRTCTPQQRRKCSLRLEF